MPRLHSFAISSVSPDLHSGVEPRWVTADRMLNAIVGWQLPRAKRRRSTQSSDRITDAKNDRFWIFNERLVVNRQPFKLEVTRARAKCHEVERV